ncbi:MAG: WXG100 family type VII secretion target [Lachnospiraceae bacterium]|nr:WXG100 family type VII secretion target [Lachnospiraceae bacterium]
MASQIRMTPEKMRQRAGEYTTQATNLNSIITKMDGLLGELQSEWEGSASDAYAERFRELRPGFVKAKELIDEISTALKNTAQIVEETDQNIANQFRS